MLTVLLPQGSCAQVRDTVGALSYLLLQLREDELVQDIVQDPHRDDVCPAVQEVHHRLTIPRLPLGDNIPNKRHPDLPHEPVRGKAGQPHCWLHSAHSMPAHRPPQEISRQCPQAPVTSWLSALGSSVQLQPISCFPNKGFSSQHCSHPRLQLECPLLRHLSSLHLVHSWFSLVPCTAFSRLGESCSWSGWAQLLDAPDTQKTHGSPSPRPEQRQGGAESTG